MTKGTMIAVLSLATAGNTACGFGGGGMSDRARTAAAAAGDPTPLAKCRVAASVENPLVTEWPASQKARLEGLAARQAVAVAYAGCELRIVETCHLDGHYAWRRTTPASDTVDIANADDLWAKLPLGAASLEGELARSGKLAVRTTISGQLELDGTERGARAPADGSCNGVTHVISAISVGAFRLLSGAGASASGGASAFGAGTGGSTSSEEHVMREAGDPAACATDGDAEPRNCSSPIQIFLEPFSAPGAPAPNTASNAPSPASSLAVNVAFPAPDDAHDHWSLHDASGTLMCDLPCNRAVAPGSGYYLERASNSGGDPSRVDVPARLPYAAGTQVIADYRAERGAPMLSALTFYGVGLPAAIGGLVTISFGIAGVGNEGDTSFSGFFIGSGIMFLAIAGATAWWFAWSHPSSFDSHIDTTAVARPSVRISPFGVDGAF